jgi:Rad3-related DNA helicase
MVLIIKNYRDIINNKEIIMEFEKMTKAELVLKAQELGKIVEDQKHLGAAVDAKDKQIIELLKVNALLEKELQESKQHKTTINVLNNSLESKNQELLKVKLDFETFKKSVPNVELVESLKNNVKILEERNKALVDFMNPYISNVRSLLKGLQGTLEMGIETEAILSEKLNKK